MQQNKVILRNGNLVFEDRTIKGDLVIENGKIAAIAEPAPYDADALEINAEGMMVMPGMIDTHAHLQDPGPYNYREDWDCA